MVHVSFYRNLIISEIEQEMRLRTKDVESEKPLVFARETEVEVLPLVKPMDDQPMAGGQVKLMVHELEESMVESMTGVEACHIDFAVGVAAEKIGDDIASAYSMFLPDRLAFGAGADMSFGRKMGS
uniref:Uncharacterized protein n=1 Tax=Leersia perrieri TaxID=77586 RepID=A0A0D9W2Z3_9ORYZ